MIAILLGVLMAMGGAGGISVCIGAVEVGANAKIIPGRVESREAPYALYKSLGATSVETYLTWNLVEWRGKDQWDWSAHDSFVRKLQEHKLKWVPFVIAGPCYATPEWFRNSPDSVPARCLEHDQDSAVQSIWNPHLLSWIERLMGEIAKRYGKTGVIESVLLGISGIFGEAIMPAGGSAWTGDFHKHSGFWCGDPYAVVNFRDYLRRKYGTIEPLNAAWGTSLKSFQEIRPALPDKAPSERAWLDQMRWYQDSMTRFADQWLAITRKHFPRTPIFLCTGGNGEREHASNFSAQCRVAAKHGAGVRITNEGSDYAANFFMTRLVATAGKHYGTYYGFEPATGENEKGTRARFYNVTASGACQYHAYQYSIVGSESMMRNFRDNLHFLRPAKPVVETAVFVPRVSQMLQPRDGFWDRVKQLRDIADFDLVDEDLLRDGALSHYKALVLLGGSVIEAEDQKRINAWLEASGILLGYNFGPVRSVEGDTSFYKRWFGDAEPGIRMMSLGKGRVCFYGGPWEQRDGFFQMLREALQSIPNRIEPDGQADGVYATVLTDAVLFLNTTDAPVEKTIHLPNGSRRTVTVPGSSIYEVKL